MSTPIAIPEWLKTAAWIYGYVLFVVVMRKVAPIVAGMAA